MSDDRVDAELAAIRERFDSLAARYPLAEMAVPDRDGLKTHGGHIATSVLDVPRLLAAVDAVLKLHAGDVNEDYPQGTPFCGECGEWAPCTTTKAIERALTGEDPKR